MGGEEQMTKTSEKSYQIYQPRLLTVLRGMQNLLLPRSVAAFVSFPLRFLPSWVEIQTIARRHWLRRLPAVISAGVLLFVFMTVFGIGQQELVLASLVSLAGLACFVIMEGLR
jgi:hypothetical protein